VFFGMPDTIMSPDGIFAQLQDSADVDDDVVLGLFSTANPGSSDGTRGSE
jgi:hypothetical protein